MAINLSDNTPRQEYTVSDGNSQQVFAVPFEFFADGDLNVYQDGTLKTLATHYRTADNNDASDPDDHISGATGYIHFTSTITASGADVKIVITRSIDIERTTDFPSSGPFDVASLNTALDKVIAIQADLQDDISRSLRLTDFDLDATLTLPDVNSRKGTVLAFNASTGAAEAGPQTTDVTKLSQITSDIATLADIEDGTVATDAISNLAAIDSDVTAVANITNNVATVAGVSSNVTTVAGIFANVTTVADNSADIQTVAENIGTISSKANAGANSDITSLSGITGNISLADNAKAQFGAGNDLQIYHDGSDSLINDNGTGSLKLQQGGSDKVEVTATGMTVTGTAIATTDTDTTNTGSVTLDFGANQNFVLTLTGNVTLANPTTEQVGQSGFIVFIQDATGGRTVSLGTDYETAGAAGLTLSTAASTTDIVPYVVAASGRILLGAPQLAFA